MAELPQTMKAWVYRASGSVERVLKLEDGVTLPHLEDYPIVVKVKSVALNPVGSKIICEIPSFLTTKPGVPEQDFSGVIAGGDLIGTDFKVGDEVYGIVPADAGQMKKGMGVLGQYTVARSSLLARKPQNLSFAQAASVPLTAMTAYHVIVTLGNVQAGERVLINGGTSGVGVFATQMAKIKGCHVVVTCSKESFEQVKKQGADELVDYKEMDLATNLGSKYGSEEGRFDLIYDTIGVADLYSNCGKYIKNSGRYYNISMPADTTVNVVKSAAHIATAKFLPRFLGGPPVSLNLVMMNMEKTASSLQTIAQWLEEGKLKTLVDSEYTFENALQGYARLNSHRAKGKVVINLS